MKDFSLRQRGVFERIVKQGNGLRFKTMFLYAITNPNRMAKIGRKSISAKLLRVGTGGNRKDFC